MRTALPAIAALLMLSAQKCAPSGGDAAALKEKKWVLEALEGRRPDLPDGAEAPWLKLEGDQLRGFGGCNSLMGSYALEGTRLSFSDLASTKKYCEGIQAVEDAVKGMLGKVDAFKLDGGRLHLLGAGKDLATFRGE